MRSEGRRPEAAFLGFGTALPEHTISPEAAQATLGRLWPRLRAAAGGELVTRHSVEPLERVVERRSLGEAMSAYAVHAPRLARQAACRALETAGTRPDQVDMVISVSCTGYLVPSLDVRLAAEIGLRPDVVRLPLTELGCSGGAAALAAAHRHLAAFPEDRVLVVAVELASLSFHPGDRSLDNLTASMVFGDGAGAAVLAAGRRGLRVVAAESRLLPDSEHVLGFDLRDTGFHVVLDRRLPHLIEPRLGPMVADFRRRHRVPAPAFYAVHAGGPRIFDAVESALGVGPADLAVSRAAFRDAGNLSSASILFSLAALSEGHSGDGLGIAFGPGVTVELLHLRR
ncbi:MAG: type III polyketide synthase [Candidatus Dormibacteraeota bacterium]|nr:type III polyketide synthase [Candidatus Dormibacteraeota bacterium]